MLDLARYPDYLTVGEALRNYWKSDWPAKGMAALTRLTVDLATGKVDSRTFDTGTANEFPFINPAQVGKRHRYAYFACNPRRPLARPAAAAREGRLRDRHRDAPRFRARRLSRRALLHRRPASGAEDDGVVVTLVFDAERKRTDVVGLDARDLAAKPLFVGAAQAPRAVHAARHLRAAALELGRRMQCRHFSDFPVFPVFPYGVSPVGYRNYPLTSL